MNMGPLGVDIIECRIADKEAEVVVTVGKESSTINENLLVCAGKVGKMLQEQEDIHQSLCVGEMQIRLKAESLS